MRPSTYRVIKQMWMVDLLTTIGRSRVAATSKMERFVKPLTIITKRSILDVAPVLDPPLNNCKKNIPAIIITSILAGLTDATPDSCSCNSFVVGAFFVLPLKLARKGGI